MDNWTLITGASEGLGVEFAKIAAQEGRKLILTARSADKLNALAEELRAKGAEVEVIPADLNALEEAERLWAAATAGRQIDMLVNNAGLGRNGAFAEEDGGGWERELSSINVNITSLTRLMKLAIPHMKNAGTTGHILNVASTAGFLPGPNMAVYHATKAFVLHLSEAVAFELRGSTVKISALCPGATETSFFDAADMREMRLLKFGAPASADQVALAGWEAALNGRKVYVPGVMNKVFAFLPRLTPRAMVVRLANIFLAKT